MARALRSNGKVLLAQQRDNFAQRQGSAVFIFHRRLSCLLLVFLGLEMNDPSPSLKPAFILALLAILSAWCLAHFVPRDWAELWWLPWLLIVTSGLLVGRSYLREWVSAQVALTYARAALPVADKDEAIPGVDNEFAEAYLSASTSDGAYPIHNLSDGSRRRDMAEKLVAYMAQKGYCEQPRSGTLTRWIGGYNKWGVARELGLTLSEPEQPPPLRDLSAESV